MKFTIKFYKPGEGKNIRFAAFIFLGLLLAFACTSLYKSVSAMWWQTSLFGIHSLGEYGIKYGIVISALSFVLGLFAIHIFATNSPKVADFLMETELELKKVSKPTKKEYLGASMAILIMVILLGLYLTLIEQILTLFIRIVI